MTNAIQDLERFMYLVIEMRTAQAAYFARKMSTDLKRSKALEDQVKQQILQLRKKGYTPKNIIDKTEQGGLF